MRQRWLRWWQTYSNDNRAGDPAGDRLQQQQVGDDRNRGAETAEHEKEDLPAVAGEAALRQVQKPVFRNQSL